MCCAIRIRIAIFFVAVFSMIRTAPAQWTDGAWPAKITSPRTVFDGVKTWYYYNGGAKEVLAVITNPLAVEVWAHDMCSALSERADIIGYSLGSGYTNLVPPGDRNERLRLMLLKQEAAFLTFFYLDKSKSDNGDGEKYDNWFAEQDSPVCEWVWDEQDCWSNPGWFRTRFPTMGDYWADICLDGCPADCFLPVEMETVISDEELPGWMVGACEQTVMDAVVTNVTRSLFHYTPYRMLNGMGIGLTNIETAANFTTLDYGWDSLRKLVQEMDVTCDYYPTPQEAIRYKLGWTNHPSSDVFSHYAEQNDDGIVSVIANTNSSDIDPGLPPEQRVIVTQSIVLGCTEDFPYDLYYNIEESSDSRSLSLGQSKEEQSESTAYTEYDCQGDVETTSVHTLTAFENISHEESGSFIAENLQGLAFNNIRSSVSRGRATLYYRANSPTGDATRSYFWSYGLIPPGAMWWWLCNGQSQGDIGTMSSRYKQYPTFINPTNQGVFCSHKLSFYDITSNRLSGSVVLIPDTTAYGGVVSSNMSASASACSGTSGDGCGGFSHCVWSIVYGGSYNNTATKTFTYAENYASLETSSILPCSDGERLCVFIASVKISDFDYQ